jgi:predicted solute-binding protein
MTHFEMKSLRIATVPYANALPLIWGIEKRLQYLEPSQMADMLRRGELDGGLVPVAEVLAHDGYEILDGCAIASDGEVKSVLMAYEPPIEKLTSVAIDPASRTSVLLLKVLLKEMHGISPQFVRLADDAEGRASRVVRLGTSKFGVQALACSESGTGKQAEAWTPNRRPSSPSLPPSACLLIGDRALKFLWTQEALPANRRLQILDLAAAWKQLTGLPFVFAVWAFRKSLLDAETANMLRTAKANGLAHIEDLVASKPADQHAFWREYFTKNIRYVLGENEKRGIEKFRELLEKSGEKTTSSELKFV